MAEVTIRYGEIDEEQIFITAAQSGRFLKKINTELRDNFGRARKNIAQGYVNEAVENVKILRKFTSFKS